MHVASMEPRSFKRGNRRHSDRHTDKMASMEPRSFKRGNTRFRQVSATSIACFNGATLIQAWKPASVDANGSAAAASMEPRSFKRGNALRTSLWRRRSMLQWSHAHSSVETPCRAPLAAAQLQWSHAHSSVETDRSRIESQAAERFNGATLIQAWKQRHACY